MVKLYRSEVVRSNCRREFGPGSSVGLQFPLPNTASVTDGKDALLFLLLLLLLSQTVHIPGHREAGIFGGLRRNAAAQPDWSIFRYCDIRFGLLHLQLHHCNKTIAVHETKIEVASVMVHLYRDKYSRLVKEMIHLKKMNILSLFCWTHKETFAIKSTAIYNATKDLYLK